MATGSRPSGRRARDSASQRRRQRRRWLLVGGVAAVLVVVVALAARGGGSGTAAAVSVRGGSATDLGSTAPDFAMPTLAGSTFAYTAGKPTLLYFMAGWCGTCVPEAQALARLHPQVGSRAALVAVDADPSDSWGSLRSFAKGVGSPGYVFAKDDGQVGRAFGVNSLDITIVLDAKGRVVHRSLGGLDDAALRAALAKAGVEV